MMLLVLLLIVALQNTADKDGDQRPAQAMVDTIINGWDSFRDKKMGWAVSIVSDPISLNRPNPFKMSFYRDQRPLTNCSALPEDVRFNENEGHTTL